MTDQEILLRLVVALALGGAIGLERRWRGHEAGPHTHAMVAAGSALFMIVSVGLGNDALTHTLGQIATGIGFLAGGVILRDGFKVRGLNTAGTVWCVSVLGCIVGVGRLLTSLEITVVIILANSLFHVLEHNVKRLKDADEEAQ